MENKKSGSAPLISVILPNYNGGRTLQRTLDSVLGQTLGDWELIVVDDASTDGSAALVTACGDPRVRLLRNESNQQVYQSMNRGIAESRGQYVCVIDSDDVWLPDKLEKQAAFLAAHPDTLALFTGVTMIDENDMPWAEGELPLVRLYRQADRSRWQWLHDMTLQGNCLAQTSVMMRRDALTAAGGYDPALVQLGDYELWLRLCSRGEIHLLPEALTQVRRVRDSHSISSVHADRAEAEKGLVLARFLQELPGDAFCAAFQGELRDVPQGEAELQAEKAFLMLRMPSRHLHWTAAQLLRQLMASPEAAAMLAEKYQFTQHDFHRLCDHLQEPGVAAKLYWITPDGLSEGRAEDFPLAYCMGQLQLQAPVPEDAFAARFYPAVGVGCTLSQLDMTCSGQPVTLTCCNGQKQADALVFDSPNGNLVLSLPAGKDRVLTISAALAPRPALPASRLRGLLRHPGYFFYLLTHPQYRKHTG